MSAWGFVLLSTVCPKHSPGDRNQQLGGFFFCIFCVSRVEEFGECAPLCHGVLSPSWLSSFPLPAFGKGRFVFPGPDLPSLLFYPQPSSSSVSPPILENAMGISCRRCRSTFSGDWCTSTHPCSVEVPGVLQQMWNPLSVPDENSQRHRAQEETGKTTCKAWSKREGSFLWRLRGCSITFPGANAPILHSHYPVLSPSSVQQSVQALLLLNVRENTRSQLKVPSALLERAVPAVCLEMCCISQSQPSPCWQALFAFPYLPVQWTVTNMMQEFMEKNLSSWCDKQP